MKRMLVTLAILLTACPALSSDDPVTAAKQLGALGNQRAGGATQTSPYDYPGYAGANVPQQQHYGSGAQIEDEARAAASTSDSAQIATTQAVQTPAYAIGPDDPIRQRSANAQSAAAQQLANQYSGLASDTAAPATSNTTEMTTASTWLHAAQETADDNGLDNGSFTFFAGEDLKCSKESLGYSNCCSDSGWGNDTGLAQCSEEEQRLGLARQAGRAHYVGRYRKGTLFKTTYRVYCTFGSQLSRMLQEQGRAQLGIGWGSARHPDCRALTPDEMARLDLDAMDFREFQDEARSQADAALATREPEDAIRRRLQQDLDR
ncbi:MAG: conjugal transfer protein TraN [Pseudomonadota bacterium]|nr:conjugal transfer protein TraN [Nevskiales bacterium]MEC9358653.1 conjugal transfer protein TraN [Pseudomonadota bacterium]